MQPRRYSPQEVQQLRHNTQKLRSTRRRPRAPADDLRLAFTLIHALRGFMPPIGWYKINPYLEDKNPEEGGELEREKKESPIYGSCQFRWRGHWYPFSQVRPLLRDALELHLPKGEISQSASYFRSCLWSEDDPVDFQVDMAIPTIKALAAKLDDLRVE